MDQPPRYGGDTPTPEGPAATPGHRYGEDASDGDRGDGERGGREQHRLSTSPGGLRITLRVPPTKPRGDDDDDGPQQQQKKRRNTPPSPSPPAPAINGEGSDSERRRRPLPSFMSALLSAPSWPSDLGGLVASGVAAATAKAAAASASDGPSFSNHPSSSSSGKRRRFKKEAKKRREPPTSSGEDEDDDDERKPSAVTTRPFKPPPSHVLFQQLGVVEAEPPRPQKPPDEPARRGHKEGQGQVAADGGGAGVRRSGRRRRYTSRWETKDDDDGEGETMRSGGVATSTAIAAAERRNNNPSPSRSSRPPPNHVLFQRPPKPKPHPVTTVAAPPTSTGRHRREEDTESDPAAAGGGGGPPSGRWHRGCVPLLGPGGDGGGLSELQRSIRRHLEVFAASPGDVAGGVFRGGASPSGKRKGHPSLLPAGDKNDNGGEHVDIGNGEATRRDVIEAFRVGIRCVHCRLAASVGAVGGGRYERFEIGTHREYYPTHFHLRDGSFGLGAGAGTGSGDGDGGDGKGAAAPHLPPGAFSFPQSLSTLNGAGVLRHLEHFLSHCPYLPAEERTKLSSLYNGGGHFEESSPSDPGGTAASRDDDDLAEFADGIGLVELGGGGGLRFGRDPLLGPSAAGGGGGEGGAAGMVPAVSALPPDEPMDPRHMDDECLRYFREAVADLRSWSSSPGRTAAAPPVGRGGMGGPLLRPDDRQLVTDFRFLCFAQLRVIHFEEADMQTRNKQPNLIPIPLGYAGFCCRFCGERSGFGAGGGGGGEKPPSVDDDDTSTKAEAEYYIAEDGRRMKRRPKQAPPPTTGRFFPSSHSSLSGCNDHLYRCRYVPDGLKRCLRVLQPLNKYQLNRLKKASHARHKVLIWSRLRDADREVKEVEENPPDAVTGTGDVLHLGTKDAGSTSEDNPSVRKDGIEAEEAERGDDSASCRGVGGDEPSSIGSESGTRQDDTTKARPPDPNLLNQYSFVQTPTGWWTCKRCCMVPLDLRSKGCLTMSPPSEDHMRHHLSTCSGDRFNLLAAAKAVEGMSQSGIIQVDDIVLPAFRSIVRELVGGNKHLVSVFTDGVRATLKGGEAAAEAINTCGLWCLFPPQVDEEAVTALLKSLPFSTDDEVRPSCLIVTDNYFRDYVHLLAPGFCLPTVSALLSRRV